MTYTELKMHLMVNYVANLSYYVSLKHKGESVANHPVFKHLAYLRTFMERLAPLDATLKYQIEKLLLENAHDSDGEESEEPATAGPNLKAFMPSVSSAVKSISVNQVKKTIMPDLPSSDGRMEIDPMLIAAQIQKAQQRAETDKKKKRKVKTYVEQDSEDERFGSEDDFIVEPKVKKNTKKAKKGKKVQVEDDDDEEIDSDEFDD
jgi:hypothetical protein